MEKGLRCKGLAGVVGEANRLPLNISRRLQLCAGESGVTALVIRRWRHAGDKEHATEPKAAATRWRIAPAPSAAGAFDELERQQWHVELLRVRGGEPHSWILEACDATGHLALFLPHWPSDRLRRLSRDAPARDSPLVTALMHGQRRIPASVDDTAARLGLACGMTVTHAQSLVPDLYVVNATPEEDEAALLRVALRRVRHHRCRKDQGCPRGFLRAPETAGERPLWLAGHIRFELRYAQDQNPSQFKR
jgi:hypothetical protein